MYVPVCRPGLARQSKHVVSEVEWNFAFNVGVMTEPHK